MNKDNYNKLRNLKVSGMADEYKRQENMNGIESYSFDQRLTLMVDTEYDRRTNNRIERLLKQAKLSEPSASVSLIKYNEDRNLDQALINELATNKYISKKTNIVLVGASGSGKTYLSNALGVQACLDGIKTRYVRLPDLLEDLEIAKSNNEFRKTMSSFIKHDLLIIDEWLLIPTNSSQQTSLLEIIEGQYRSGSLIICTQYKVESWHSKLGKGAIADAIMDRIISNSQTIFIESKVSMRFSNND